MVSPRRTLIFIFLIGVFIRFLYFPFDISFTYDQARDAFVSQEILHGHLKILGPPSSIPGLYHGAVSYYFLGPLYFLSHGSPELVSAGLRLFNCLGIFLVYLIGKKLFNIRTGLISALIYAFSFEQTQFALFLGHPALAVITILLFYYGLARLHFDRDPRGLTLAGLALGLSVQFHLAMINLFFIFLTVAAINYRCLNRKTCFQALLALIVTLSTYILAELKFNFRTIRSMLSIFIHPASHQPLNFSNLYLIACRYVRDNFFALPALTIALLIFLLAALVFLILTARTRRAGIFLALWLAGGLLPYLLDHSALPIYYYTIAGSVSLVILAAYLIAQLWHHSRLLGSLLLSVVVLSDFSQIVTYNPAGVIPAVTVQSDMLLSDEKQLIDYVYTHSAGHPFAVNAVTIPYAIDTTWSYLFEWYGQPKYGYLPLWGGDSAAGFPGHLFVVTARSALPPTRYTIIEHGRGLPPGLKDRYLQTENYFTRVISEHRFGQFILQTRTPI